jgi:dienelactone hydrolase
MSNPSPTIDVAALREGIGGDVYGPGDPDWDSARSAWNLAVVQDPELVAMPVDADDVARLVSAAAETGLRVSVQGTGHNAAAYEDLDRTLLIRTNRMRAVEVDPVTHVARVEAGALWADVAVPAAAQGLAALQGSSHDVGAVGYSLGGGVSFLARKHGLASERVRAIEIVTADGTLRRADAERDPDLFWALRGGGGNFGVVTAIEIELLEIEQLYAGALFFPFERAREVLQAWREWADGVPEEMTSVGRLLQFPPLPDIPEPMRGNSFAVVEAFFLGSEEEGGELLAPLRELGPDMDTVAMIGFEELLQVHMDPPEPVPYLSDHQMLTHLDRDAVDRLVDVAGPGSGSSLLGFELRHVGGALSRRPEGAGALGALEGEFMTFGVGMVAGPEAVPGLQESLARAREALAPLDSGAPYLNFAEHSVAPETIYGRERLERLREVKQRYDAADLFRGNHPIDAA